jgi:hypothetical protein
MNERWRLYRAASSGGASEGGAIHRANSGDESGRASRCQANRSGGDGGGVRGLDCSDASERRISSRGAFRIFSGEEPLRHSRLHFGLDPLLKNFVQLLAQIGDGVQTTETKGFDRGVGRSEEIFERPVDGVLSRRRALLCIPLGARHCRQRYHTRYYRLEYGLAVPAGERGPRLVVSINAEMGREAEELRTKATMRRRW